MGVISRFLTVLLFCLAGCCLRSTKEAPSQGNLLITIEWYGAVTKPIPELGFANKETASELKRWVNRQRTYRSGKIISYEECNRLREMLGAEKFRSLKTAVQPTAEIQQYVLTWHPSKEVLYFPLGYNNSTDRKSVV